MFGAPHHGAVGAAAVHLDEAQERGHRFGHPGVHVDDVQLAGAHRLGQHLRPLLAKRHLDVAAGSHRGDRVAQPQHEVGDDEAVPSPLLAQHPGEQRAVVTAPLAVERVVGAHHRGHTLVRHPLEMGQVHLVQRPLASRDVHPEPGVLHRVAGEVLHAGHHVLLQASGERGRHLPHVARVLAIGFLSPAPRRMAQQVQADRTGEGGAGRPQLGAHDPPHPLLEFRVEGGPAGHRHRERGGRSDHATPWTVGEVEARDAQPFDVDRRPGMGVVAPAQQIREAGPERHIPVEAAQLLLQGHQRHQPSRLGPSISAPANAARCAVECRHRISVSRPRPGRRVRERLHP